MLQKTSRRQFLEETMFSAAAAVAASAVGQLSASEQEIHEVARRVPGRKLEIAVVGVRGRGKSHLTAFQQLAGANVRCVVDVDREIGLKRCGEIAKRQRGRAPRFYTDIREALDDPAIDIVSIASPNHWHALMAIWALQAGKHVLLEVPVSHNVSEGRAIVAASRAANRVCQVGLQSRSNPGTRQAMGFLHGGGIGELSRALAICYRPRPPIGPPQTTLPPPTVDFNLWSGPASLQAPTRQRFHHDWQWFWNYGNGELGYQGVHQMDIARWGMQLPRLSNRVFSYGGRFGPVDAGETANTQVVVHSFDSPEREIRFELRSCSMSGVKQSRDYRNIKAGVVFEGSDGFLIMTTYYSGAAFDRQGRLIKSFCGQGNHFARFLATVRGERVLPNDADILEGHLSSSLCHLGNISYRLGSEVSVEAAASLVRERDQADQSLETFSRMLDHLRKQRIDLQTASVRVGDWLEFNPVSEKFHGQHAADALLSRAYRSPFILPDAAQQT
jgi:predicted dehydrogenase